METDSADKVHDELGSLACFFGKGMRADGLSVVFCGVQEFGMASLQRFEAKDKTGAEKQGTDGAGTGSDFFRLS